MNILLKYAILFFVALPTSLKAESFIADYKAPFYIGKYVEVCGVLNSVKETKKVTYLNIGEAYPKQKVSFLVWGDKKAEFSQKFGNLITYRNKVICATGKIKEYKGLLQISVNRPDLLKIK